MSCVVACFLTHIINGLKINRKKLPLSTRLFCVSVKTPYNRGEDVIYHNDWSEQKTFHRALCNIGSSLIYFRTMNTSKIIGNFSIWRRPFSHVTSPFRRQFTRIFKLIHHIQNLKWGTIKFSTEHAACAQMPRIHQDMRDFVL